LELNAWFFDLEPIEVVPELFCWVLACPVVGAPVEMFGPYWLWCCILDPMLDLRDSWTSDEVLSPFPLIVW